MSVCLSVVRSERKSIQQMINSWKMCCVFNCHHFLKAAVRKSFSWKLSKKGQWLVPRLSKLVGTTVSLQQLKHFHTQLIRWGEWWCHTTTIYASGIPLPVKPPKRMSSRDVCLAYIGKKKRYCITWERHKGCSLCSALGLLKPRSAMQDHCTVICFWISFSLTHDYYSSKFKP